MGSRRAFLKSRSRKVDLESKLGTTEIIDPGAAATTKSGVSTGASLSSGVTKCTDGVGWHCRVCDCFLKDSLTYLDHINGKKHQRYLGYSMRVEKSSTEEVSGVLKELAEKKREMEGRTNGGIVTGRSGEAVDFEDLVRAKDEEALRRKAERARKREKRKMREKEKSYDTADGFQAGETPEENNGEEDVGEKDENVYDEGDDGVDPNIAAMMGFSGFGGSRK